MFLRNLASILGGRLQILFDVTFYPRLEEIVPKLYIVNGSGDNCREPEMELFRAELDS